MNRGKIKGVIFDLDGTLILSSIDFPGMKQRMIAILEDNGVPPGILSPKETTVTTLEKTERIWDEQGTHETEKKNIREAIEEIMNKTELEAIPSIKAVPGAAEAVRELKERGYKLAVLTRGHKTYAVEALRKSGMLRYFELVLGREETPKPKPHAEALEHTAELLGLSLDEVVFVGDHPIDSTCAENAGVRFIAVLSGPTKEKTWAEHGQETILNSVRDLPDYLAEQ